MLKKLTNKKGFTFLELLLSVAIIGLLAGLSLPVYRTLMKKNDLDIATNTIVSSLRRAQVLSQSVAGDTPWGLKTQTGNIIIFKGENFAARDENFDEIFDLPTTIEISGVTVLFAKFTGFPEPTGVINLSTEGETQSVSINEKGTIEF